jgi:hypothetical protein
MSLGARIKGSHIRPQAHVVLVSTDTTMTIPAGVLSVTVESNGSTSINTIVCNNGAVNVKILNTGSAAITMVDDTGNLNNVSGNRALAVNDSITYERRNPGDADLWEVDYNNIA